MVGVTIEDRMTKLQINLFKDIKPVMNPTSYQENPYVLYNLRSLSATENTTENSKSGVNEYRRKRNGPLF